MGLSVDHESNISICKIKMKPFLLKNIGIYYNNRKHTFNHVNKASIY